MQTMQMAEPGIEYVHISMRRNAVTAYY